MNSQQRQGTQPLEENIYLQSTLMLEWYDCVYSLQRSPDRRKLFIILPSITQQLKLIEDSKFESSDIRNNAFGAQVQVLTQRRTTDYFQIQNLNTFQCGTAYRLNDGRYALNVMETIDLTQNVALATNVYVKDAIALPQPVSASHSWDRPFRVYFIFTLADPYYKGSRSDVASDRATFNSPVEHKDSSNKIYGNVKAIWICDKTSGKVLRKIDVSQPNSMILDQRAATKSKMEAAEVRVVEFQKKRAADGEDVAQYDLGLRYLDGKGVEPNRDEAIKLLRQSAAQNNTKAKKKLAELGVPLP